MVAFWGKGWASSLYFYHCILFQSMTMTFTGVSPIWGNTCGFSRHHVQLVIISKELSNGLLHGILQLAFFSYQEATQVWCISFVLNPFCCPCLQFWIVTYCSSLKKLREGLWDLCQMVLMNSHRSLHGSWCCLHCDSSTLCTWQVHTVTIATKLDVHGFAMVQIFVMGNLKLKVV